MIGSIELTANEWRAAERMGKAYEVWLVLDCLGSTPRIEVIVDPHGKFAHLARPSSWDVRLLAQAQGAPDTAGLNHISSSAAPVGAAI